MKTRKRKKRKLKNLSEHMMAPWTLCLETLRNLPATTFLRRKIEVERTRLELLPGVFNVLL